MAQVRNKEWLNENSLRAYPLCESATAVDDAGAKLNPTMITDMCVTVPSAYASGLRLAAFGITRMLVSVSLTSDAGPVAAGTYLRTSGDVLLPLIPIIPGVAGFIVFGAATASAPLCNMRFSDATQSAIAPSVVNILPGAGVSALTRSGNHTAAVGHVTVSGDDNTLLTVAGTQLQVDLTTDFATKLRQAQGSVDVCPTPAIRGINGVSADTQGRILIRFI